MENKKTNIKREELEKNEIQKEKEKEENENNTENDIKNEIIENKDNSANIGIKKPIMPENEYQNMIKKRSLMTKNSKYKPMKFLFGRKQNVLKLNNSTTETVHNINNTNIQINNYTTYLTNTEIIKEEQYQIDGKTLKVENPGNYSMKQLNYKYINDQLNKIMIIYIKKINECEDRYNFTNKYLSFITNIFEKLSQPYISFLNNLFITRIKPNLKYFQKIIPIYQEFSFSLEAIESSYKIDINNNPNANLINSIKQLNITNADNLKTVSNNLLNLILNNQLFIQIDTAESKFIEISNKMKLYIDKLIKRRNKFNLKYKNEIEPYFIGIKQNLNNSSLFYDYLTRSRDFLYIEYYIVFNANKIFNKISQFLINMEFLFKSSLNIFCDYLELLNNLVKSFYNDNKNVINISSLLPKKLVIDLNNIINSKNIRKYIRKRFSFNKIIENCVDNKFINDINHSLLNYRDNLIQYNLLKPEEIKEIINFNLITYDSSENFIQFLLRLIPERYIFKLNEMVELQMNIKKNAGILKGWTDSLLIITYQGHILLFENQKIIEKNKKNKKEVINDSNKKVSKQEIINSIIEEDNKKEEIQKIEKSDNNELYEAIKNGKLTDLYIRKNFGMNKLLYNTGKKLLQLYENIFDFRQYKPITIDVLTDDNMNILIDTILRNKYL